MHSIQLYSQQPDFTLVSNQFIDQFLPAANGFYVKIYLYFLRCFSKPDATLSISSVAEQLGDSEKDILRGLAYWEDLHLITLKKNENDELDAIYFHPIPDVTQPHLNTPDNSIKEQLSITREPMQAKPKIIEKPVYSPAQIEELSKQKELKWLLHIIEVYLERLLKPADVQLILYLYESIGFSSDLIMYLYEYCVSKNKKNPSYIESVALSWIEEGIDTVEKAEQAATLYNANYNAINKAFGLNRAPGDIEKRYIKKWTSQLGFSIELIVEACNRTLLRTQKPDFNYADKILENWKQLNVTRLEDVTLLDQKHATSSSTKKFEKTPAKPANKGRFHSFPQRSYSQKDLQSLERHLISHRTVYREN